MANYVIADQEIITEANGLRVSVLTLAGDDKVPWHYHSNVPDIFVCVEGTTVVDTKAPRGHHELSPGENVIVPAKTAHQVTSKDNKGCRFTIVQGVGTYDFVPVGEPASTEQR